MHSLHLQKNTAFSLVELSIVLVILGLLVGGIMGGQSLIRASELRSITTQYNGYVTAARTFRDKYYMAPGDLNNATQFWGTAAGTGSDAACRAAVGTGTATCNGNGDGKVQATSSSPWETFRFWQHLANAGLIEGNYSGVSGSNMSAWANSSNSPAGKLSNSMWYVDSDYYGSGCGICGSYAAPGPWFNVNTPLNYLMLGAYTSGGGISSRPLLKAEEVWNIDTKMDDGKPSTGKINVYCYGVGGYTNCASASSATDQNATYLLDSGSNGSPTAAITFNNAF